MKLITTQELEKLVKKGDGYVLVDVRERNEMAHGMIPTAHNLPLSEFQKALDLEPGVFSKKYGFEKFSKSDLVIFHCRTGGRSSQATSFAESKGYNAANYAGSIQEWSKIDKNVKMY